MMIWEKCIFKDRVIILFYELLGGFLNWYKKKIIFEKLYVRNIWVCEFDNFKFN